MRAFDSSSQAASRMDLPARTRYLKDMKDLTIRCQSKLDSLLASIGWSCDSLDKKYDSVISNEAVTDSSTSNPESQGGNAQLEDFEKRYNDLLIGLPSHQKKDLEKSEAESLAELLEFERNAKRRRISYKNKVHTKNKSHTEVLRELVREQMEVLKEISGEDTKEERLVKNPVENEDDSVGLIQVNFTEGNPHSVWQKIGQVVENRGLDSKRQPSNADDGSRDIRSRLHSRDRSSNVSYSRDERSSWRGHDGRDNRYTKDRRRDKYDRNYPRNKDDYSRHRQESEKRKHSSPDS